MKISIHGDRTVSRDTHTHTLQPVLDHIMNKFILAKDCKAMNKE